ncbi:MAG: hypothetical protein ABI689_18820 [Thermoanaerobaculia bacterium]
MKIHYQVVKKLMKRPGVRAEVERLEREETALLDERRMRGWFAT